MLFNTLTALTDFWDRFYMNVFGANDWMGLDMGFWVSMFVTCLVVVIMNVVFWNMKPKPKHEQIKHHDGT